MKKTISEEVTNHARAMAQHRLDNETEKQKEARRERCKGIVKHRWANTTPKQRKEIMAKIRLNKKKV